MPHKQSLLLTTALAGVTCLATAGMAQSVVQIKTITPSQLKFSGVVVSPDWVLTQGAAVDGIDPCNLEVDDGNDVIPVICVESDYTCCPIPLSNLALLRLGRPTTLAPEALPDPSETFAGQSAEARYYDGTPPSLQVTDGTIITNAQLAAYYGSSVSDQHVGFMETGGITTAVQRGALFAEIAGTPQLVGIASFGVTPPDNYPTVYTRVSYFLGWINATITSPSVPCVELPACTGPTFTLTASISGAPTGADWEWQITSTFGDFDDTCLVPTDGVTPGDPADDLALPTGTWDEHDICQRFADSINAYFASLGYTGPPPAQSGGFGSQVLLSVTLPCPFELFVNGCQVSQNPCPFNPMIQRVLLPGFDCNGNGWDDLIDIESGTSLDSNGNTVPDECEGLPAVSGLMYQTLGNATVETNGNGDLVVSNLGSNLQDGVGFPVGWMGRIDFSRTDRAAEGTRMNIDGFARYENGTESQLMSMQVTYEADNVMFSPDFTESGAQQVIMNVFDHGTLVHAEIIENTRYWPIVVAALDLLRNAYFGTVEVTRPDGTHISATGVCFSNPANAMIVPPSGTPVTGNAVAFAVGNDQLPVSIAGVTRVDLLAADTPQVTINHVSAGQFGNEHTGLGGTTLWGGPNPYDPTQPAVWVDGLQGPSDVIGILPHYGQPATEIGVETTPISLAQPGQELRLASQGTFGGQGGVELGSTMLASMGSGLAQLTYDFSPVGTTSARLAVYNQNVFQGQVVVDNLGASLLSFPGGDIRIGGCGKLGGPWNPPCFYYQTPSPFILLTGAESGAALEGDEIRVIAEGIGSVESLGSFQIGGTDLGQFAIVDETVATPSPTFCTADITGPAGAPDGNVDALDFLALIGQWGSPCTGSCAADITGPAGASDGNVDALDFLLLIGQWGSPGNCPSQP